MNTLSPDCRFLCASAAAYGIQWDGSLQSTEPYYSRVGFEADPVVFAAGVDSIDGCLVGTNQDGVMVAFRGTLPPNHASLAVLLDWLNDADSFPAVAPGIPGAVHLGFWKALMSLWVPVLAEIRRQATRPDGSLRPIYLTGHSKGGALACLAAMQLVRVENLRPAGVITFASPHAGDEDFATAYDAAGISSLRYEFQDDVVPHVPPSAPFLEILRKIPLTGRWLDPIAGFDYRPVGTLRFVDWSGAIVGDSGALERQRFEKLLEHFLLLEEVRIAEDHFSTCGGGYMTYICPTGVCPAAGQLGPR
jgi:hypothetical protein